MTSPNSSPLPEKIDAAVVVNNLTRKFGNFTAVDSISFSIPRGEIFGLLGPNGAGKTTTMRMLCGILQPTSGTATYSGLRCQHPTRRSQAADRIYVSEICPLRRPDRCGKS